jgi:hypothetical protein
MLIFLENFKKPEQVDHKWVDTLVSLIALSYYEKRRIEIMTVRFQESRNELKIVSQSWLQKCVYIHLAFVALASHSANPLFSVSVRIANHP